MITAIVTAGKNWAIGKNGLQVTSIPDDTRYIRTVTSGNIAIMGRKTFESIPQGQLPTNRTNIVLSKSMENATPGVIICRNVNDVIEEVNKIGKEAFVIGGGTAFNSLLPYTEEIQVTFVDYIYDADTYFEDLDRRP